MQQSRGSSYRLDCGGEHHSLPVCVSVCLCVSVTEHLGAFLGSLDCLPRWAHSLAPPCPLCALWWIGPRWVPDYPANSNRTQPFPRRGGEQNRLWKAWNWENLKQARTKMTESLRFKFTDAKEKPQGTRSISMTSTSTCVVARVCAPFSHPVCNNKKKSLKCWLNANIILLGVDKLWSLQVCCVLSA